MRPLNDGDVVLQRSGVLFTLSHRLGSSDDWRVRGGGAIISQEFIESECVVLTPEIGRAVWRLLYLGAVTMPRELPANV